MKFITTQQTPVYRVAANGFYQFVRSLPAATELAFASTSVDSKSNRQVGILSNGEVMYLDALTPVLPEVEVRSTRLWGWLLALGLAGFGTYKFIKSRSKKGLGATVQKSKKTRLYEVYFNNNKRHFDRISATSKKEAEAKMREFYPGQKVTGSILIG